MSGLDVDVTGLEPAHAAGDGPNPHPASLTVTLDDGQRLTLRARSLPALAATLSLWAEDARLASHRREAAR